MSLLPFNSETLQQPVFGLHRKLSENIPNSEIIATQIGHHTANCEHFTFQTISSIEYPYSNKTWQRPLNVGL